VVLQPWWHNKNPGVPGPVSLPPMTCLQTLAKVLCDNLPGSVEKRAFSATDGILSPDPDFSCEANQHPLIELTGADHVQAKSRVFSAGAEGGVTCESRRRSFFDLDHVLLSDLIIKV
jgi:hypothetical protein